MNSRFYSGDNLKEFVEVNIGSHKYKRKIIKDILKRINHVRMISLVGDRRRGKTSTLFGIIKEINDYSKAVYVSLSPETDINELQDEISKNYRDFYVFIDEITNIKDLDIVYQQVTDGIKPFCKKLFVSGTWSQATVGYELEGWFDRVDIFKLNPISLIDAKEFIGQGIDSFMFNGGYIQDMEEDVSFIDSFMQYYFLCNKESKDMTFAKYLLAMLLNEFPVKETRFQKIINTNIDKISKVISKFKGQADLRELYDINVVKDDIQDIWETLLKKDISKSVINLNPIRNFKFYNSDILSFWTVNKILQFENVNISKGILMESYILRYSDNLKFFLRGRKGREIDAIDLQNKKLFEIKHKNKITEGDLIHLSNKQFLEENKVLDFSKNIIYLGESREEDGIYYWNIYDYVREYMEEHLLEPWEERSVEIDLNWT